VLTLLTMTAFAQQCPGDCDADGWTVADGDCDDGDPAIHPGQLEDCSNTIDDDCDGFANEGCDRDAQRGSLEGGPACGAAEGTLAGLWLLPLLPLVWRRR
jgi:hypothetical protein